jgi:hypothetical protein
MSREAMKQIAVALRALMTGYMGDAEDAIAALEAELAKPEQEPYCWAGGGAIYYAESDIPKDKIVIPLYTAPQKYCPSENNAAYEKGFVEGMAKQMHSSVDRAVNAMGKPWVGLTGTEINHIFAANVGYPERMCRAIEAKLKEKNEH